MLSLNEIFDLAVMTLFIGFLFSDLFQKPQAITDMLGLPYKISKGLFNWDNILYAAAIAAPGIILHELAHKFTANAFGLPATFHAFYADPTIRMIGIFALVLKLMGSGFFIVVPGFVTHPSSTPLINATISFAGPATNLALWFGTWILLKRKHFEKRILHALIMSKKLNLFLFIFNMLPIPGFDGFNMYMSLFRAIF